MRRRATTFPITIGTRSQLRHSPTGVDSCILSLGLSTQGIGKRRNGATFPPPMWRQALALIRGGLKTGPYANEDCHRRNSGVS